MIYTIMMQLNPGSGQVYVSTLNQGDPVYSYSTIEEAQAKMTELKSLDPTYRAYYIESYPEYVDPNPE